MSIWGKLFPLGLAVQPSPPGWCRADALVSGAGTTISTNNGSRTPVTKRYDTEAAAVLCYNAGGNAYGGNWFSTLLVAPKEFGMDAVRLVVSGGNVTETPTEFTYNGKQYYASTASTSPTWGGSTVYNNPLNVPTLQDVQVFVVNGASFYTASAQTVGDLLQLS